MAGLTYDVLIMVHLKLPFWRVVVFFHILTDHWLFLHATETYLYLTRENDSPYKLSV